MADADLQIKAMDVLFSMYTAIKNVQLHGNESPVVTNSVERLYMHLQEILRHESPLIFAESEKQALLRGVLLNEQEQKTIHVSFLLDILQDFGLQSISFDKGLQREELNIFIKLLAKSPKAVQFDGGLSKLARENKIIHIYTENKLCDKNQGISDDISDDPSCELDISSAEDPVSKSIAEMMGTLSRLDKMEGTIEAFFSKEQKDLISRCSQKVIEWIKAETTLTDDYKRISLFIQRFLRELIQRKFFAEALPIIDVFNKINTGVIPKDDNIRKVSLNVIRNLASENNINILFTELNTNENKKQNEAGQILAGLGNIKINKLLDIVRDSSDSKERVRTIHLIEDIGEEAIPIIRERFNINDPWYFLRNIAYILGRIGNESCIDMLQPLLMHKDKRVRMEALKSTALVGGNKKGALLLSVLHQAEQEFRLQIIEMLGKIKFTDALPDLLDLLKNKSSMDKGILISMQEKICEAIGSIGSSKAIPTLSEIAESKSFLGMGSYPAEVKSAAERALASIKRKQTPK